MPTGSVQTSADYNSGHRHGLARGDWLLAPLPNHVATRFCRVSAIATAQTPVLAATNASSSLRTPSKMDFHSCPSQNPVALCETKQYPASVIMAQNVLRLLALLCCAFSLAAPASARSLHLVDHVSAPIEAGEFHSHDENGVHGEREKADPDLPSVPDDDAPKKFGHSHMPSSVSDLSQAPEPRVGERHLVSDDAHVAADLPSLTTRGWSPPVRPPRSA